MLADLGAEVIKVEPPDGDPMRPLDNVFESAQRGKRSLAVDLRSAEGREIAYKLVARADVVHQNWRPGAAERLGLDHESVRRINPSVIYCFSPGFGSAGPKAGLQSFAPLQSGFCGLYYEAAGADNPPIGQLGNEDYFNSLLGACGILMALRHRRRTGEGQYLESPQVNSALFATSEVIVGEDGRTLSAFALDHEQTGLDPLYRLYRTRDGWICIAGGSDRDFAGLCRALERPEWAEDRRFATVAGRAANGQALAALLAGRFAEGTAAEWFGRLDGNGVACEVPGPDCSESFFWEDEHLGSGRVVEFEHRRWGRVREIGQLIRLSETPGFLRGPSPLLGEHTEEILAELGYGPSEIARLKDGRVIAGLAD
jgi:crotonobetainyl-CoA:carnitine CoA-transferase CaiB-like acyl-CoA transferase